MTRGHAMSVHALLQEDGEQRDARRSPRRATPPAGRQRRLLPRLLLLLGGTVVGLVIGEIAVRIVVAVTHRVQLVVSDDRAGWTSLPNLRNVIRGGEGGQYTISTDAEGHRLTRGVDEPADATRPTVIVVGDSYVQCTAVNDSDAFPWILAHEMPVNVVNLAVLGYGTDQELVSLESYLEAHPNLGVRDVVVLVSANDFIDVQLDYHYLARSKPRFRVIDGRLDRPTFRLGLSDRLMNVSYLYWLVNSKQAELFGPGPRDPADGIDIVVACLAAMRDIATRRGAGFHVLIQHLRELPKEHPPMGESRWAEVRDRTGGTDITDRLRPPNGASPFGYDNHHLSPEVNHRVAAIVKERLEPASSP